jgi:hypothetical protein
MSTTRRYPPVASYVQCEKASRVGAISAALTKPEEKLKVSILIEVKKY